ncbi:MAG TPA: hypothetical protein VKV20_04500 [Ktedonobacteraceae bacterium]|nr:hypothetical protein [Ktedonobacteraceae bacterium]
MRSPSICPFANIRNLSYLFAPQGKTTIPTTAVHSAIIAANCSPNSSVAIHPSTSAELAPTTSIYNHPLRPQARGCILAPFASAPASTPITIQNASSNVFIYKSSRTW